MQNPGRSPPSLCRIPTATEFLAPFPPFPQLSICIYLFLEVITCGLPGCWSQHKGRHLPRRTRERESGSASLEPPVQHPCEHPCSVYSHSPPLPVLQGHPCFCTEMIFTGPGLHTICGPARMRVGFNDANLKSRLTK
jgi:hypothetical protein